MSEWEDILDFLYSDENKCIGKIFRAHEQKISLYGNCGKFYELTSGDTLEYAYSLIHQIKQEILNERN